MTRSKKLLVAATLLAAGYVFASLLGAPRPRLEALTVPVMGLPLSNPTKMLPAPAGDTGGQAVIGSVRLLPEISSATTKKLGEPESGGSWQNIDAALAFAATPLATEKTPASLVAEPALPLLTTRSAPRARLKNETPRPLNGPTTEPSPISKQGVWNRLEEVAGPRPELIGPPRGHSQVQQAGFASLDTVGPPVVREPVPIPIQPLPQSATNSPLPWPAEEPTPLRMHVVVDGDTLAKLAGRYLDDPRCSAEIFALNRSVVSDPELLPIGVELKIPMPQPTERGIRAPPLSSVFESLSAQAATPAGFVPVRPLPASSTAMPQAQLMRPLPVE